MKDHKILRIIGGRDRGRKLYSLKGISTRPTPSRVREALFNILGVNLAGCCFLDLFAGTGAVGLEAYSRGADRITLVEKSPLALQVLKKNLELIGADSSVRLLKQDVYAYNDFAEEDYIFCSPPYPEIDRMPELGRQIAKGAESGCWWILQHPKSYDISEIDDRWNPLETRIYGINALTFFQKIVKDCC